MPASLGETLKEILDRIGPKVNDQWPCRRCGLMQPAGVLSVQEDLCGACLTERRRAAARERILAQVGLKYGDCTFESFRQVPATARAVQALRLYAESPKGGVFLYGPSGAGKTHLATAVMRALMERGQDCRYATCPELLVHLKRSLEQAQPSLEEEIQAYAQAPVLILDDFGVGTATDWVRQVLHVLLDRRDRYLRPLLLISNLPLDRIALLMGDAIASRVAGMCRIIRLAGKDRRLEGPTPSR